MSELIAFFAGWFAMMFLWYMVDYKVVFAAYHKGKADATPKWNPVSKGLPDEEGHYIVTDDSGGEKWVDSSVFLRGDDGSVYWDFANVTAWMPLPQPYKEGE